MIEEGRICSVSLPAIISMFSRKITKSTYGPGTWIRSKIINPRKNYQPTKNNQHACLE